MDELNQVVQKAKELYHEYGRTPLRVELISAGLTNGAREQFIFKRN